MVAAQQTFPTVAAEDIATKVAAISKEIIEQYLADERVWVVGFSGGKDSTTLLQLVFYALQSLPKEKLHKEVHVLCNDTLVENQRGRRSIGVAA